MMRNGVSGMNGHGGNRIMMETETMGKLVGDGVMTGMKMMVG